MTSNNRSRQLTRQHSKKRTPAKSPATEGAIFTKQTFKAFLITLAIGAGLILTLSLGAYFHPDPDSIIRPLALIAAALTAFFGGFTAGKLRGGAPAICGLINGILLTAVMLLLSLCFRAYSSGYSQLVSTLIHAAVPVLSFAGALLGTKKSIKTTRRR